MEIVRDKEKFFQRNEKEFLQYLHKKNGTKLTKENLVFSFFDLDGKGYYKFPKDLALPMARLGKLQEFMTWLSAGITGDEMDKMLDSMESAIMEGLKTGKSAAKIGWAISELRERKKMIVHEELFYNIIAIQIIRDDEMPTEFNNDIQMAKVNAFRKLNTENDTFFLNIHEYLTALNWSNITKDELLNILKDSTIRSQAAEKMMQSLYEKLSPEVQQTLNKI